MEGSNYSSFLSEVAVNHLKKARGEIWPKRSERRNNTKKPYQDEDKKSAINKKNNSQIKKPHLKMIPIKRQLPFNFEQKKKKRKKKMSPDSFKNVNNKMCLQIIYILYIWINLALNNLQWLICHKTKPNQIIYI